MKTNIFDFNLPKNLIAQTPIKNRDQSKMLVLNRKTGEIKHKIITDIINYINPSDTLVLNNTKVIPARVLGEKKTGGKLEVLFLEENSEKVWEVLIKVSRRPAIGENFLLGKSKVSASIIEEKNQGIVKLKINYKYSVLHFLEKEGITPLPPYIQRNSNEKIYMTDKSRYQTVYASNPGAVAAPTAGLHFTKDLINNIKKKGTDIAEITLHVGLGTFRPVSCENIEDHKMHSEFFQITSKSATCINKTKKEKGKIIAVGSTSVRALESLQKIKAIESRTNIFIYPPYNFKHVDIILTNFHLPKSSLLMMMSAFVDHDVLMSAYQEAIKYKYRFFSYGDCMLIL